ncbi:Predicted branched-chain amino acid permease (azaleucine resistance) [Polaromonas sp. OV174]|uniref:AzlC family ABC transporter permease n=1 Tax=Polaromonas sp. OV174 TaxID=1855300 RepID=UPI0008EB0162|nr:AzlC family ABC transporter permease [Polaromonas sp. OV174]SFC47186.1 Predicted branched-chain amino acid permease (azaleucine resistance) [Polaromonas sp. OV174]
MSSPNPSPPPDGTLRATVLTPAVRMGLSIAVATGLYGISFGALAVAAGLSVGQAMALSLLMFTGGSQFAFIGVIAGGGAASAALGAAALLGVRNAVYGMQMNRMLVPKGWRKALAAHLTIDESAATASGQTAPDEQRRGFWTAGLGVFLLWNLFTLLGALLGDALGDPRQWGLDGAAVAAFLGLLWPRLRQREPVALAVLCGVATALAVPLLPPGLPILLAAVVGAAWGWWGHAPDADAHAPVVKKKAGAP